MRNCTCWLEIETCNCEEDEDYSKMRQTSRTICKEYQRRLISDIMREDEESGIYEKQPKMTRENIIKVALAEMGYKETPANSNKTKYGKWFGFDGVPWCGMFVSWVYDKAGFPLGNIGFLKGFAGCQTAVAYFKKHNQIVTEPKMGDIAFFDWNNDGRYDHTGIFHKPLDEKELRFECLEGNTSMSNQSNGGEVMTRSRSYTNVIFARPSQLNGI